MTLQSIDPLDLEKYNQIKQENMSRQRRGSHLKNNSDEGFSSQKVIKVSSMEETQKVGNPQFIASMSKSMTLEPEKKKYSFGSVNELKQDYFDRKSKFKKIILIF